MISKNVTPQITHNGDDETLLWSVPFPTFEAESLDVYVLLLIDGTKTVLVKDVDFTLNDANVNGVTASITLLNSNQGWIDAVGGGLDITYALHIDFDNEAFQPNSFRSLGNFSPISMENSLDRLTMAIKAVDYRVSLLDSTQTDINTADIVAIKADIINIKAAAVLLTDRVLILEQFVNSSSVVALNNSTAVHFGLTENIAFVKHMILEYICIRSGSTQYGRILLVGDGVTYTMSPTEKVGDVGISFTVTNSGGVHYLRYTTTNTGADGLLDWSLYKFLT